MSETGLRLKLLVLIISNKVSRSCIWGTALVRRTRCIGVSSGGLMTSSGTGGGRKGGGEFSGSEKEIILYRGGGMGNGEPSIFLS